MFHTIIILVATWLTFYPTFLLAQDDTKIAEVLKRGTVSELLEVNIHDLESFIIKRIPEEKTWQTMAEEEIESLYQYLDSLEALLRTLSNKIPKSRGSSEEASLVAMRYTVTALQSKLQKVLGLAWRGTIVGQNQKIVLSPNAIRALAIANVGTQERPGKGNCLGIACLQHTILTMLDFRNGINSTQSPDATQSEIKNAVKDNRRGEILGASNFEEWLCQLRPQQNLFEDDWRKWVFVPEDDRKPNLKPMQVHQFTSRFVASDFAQ